MYMDSRQSISSLMGPPGGYPHLPTLGNTAPPMTGDFCFCFFVFNEKKIFFVFFLQYFDRIPQTEMVKESQVHLSWVSPDTVDPEWMFGFICSGMNFSQKMFSSRLARFRYNWLVILITIVRPRECPNLSHVAPQQSEDTIIKSINKTVLCTKVQRTLAAARHSQLGEWHKIPLF